MNVFLNLVKRFKGTILYTGSCTVHLYTSTPRHQQHSSHKSPENVRFGTERDLFIIKLEEIHS